jgi:hypothetical protein
VLVEHPQMHGLGGRRAHERRQPRGQLRLERHRLGRVLFRVGLARHLELPAHAVQELPHPAHRELPAGALFDPRLRVLRLPELPGLQPRDKLGGHRTPHRRRPARRRTPRQQRRHPAGHHRVPVGEHRLPADVRHPHDLRHRQLVLRDQPHHQQPPAGPLRLGLRPRRLDLRHQLRSQFREGSCHASASRFPPAL